MTMTDREQLIKDFEHAVNKARGDYYDYVDLTVEDSGKILKILRGQKLPTESASWTCHLYRTGTERFECGHCHKTSWRDSAYCPDCGTKMDGTVNVDD